MVDGGERRLKDGQPASRPQASLEISATWKQVALFVFQEIRMTTVTVLGLALLVAGAVERLTEWLIKPLLENMAESARVPTLRAIVFVLAAIASFLLNIDLLLPLMQQLGIAPVAPWVTPLLTAVFVGGGSNFLSDIWPSAP